MKKNLALSLDTEEEVKVVDPSKRRLPPSLMPTSPTMSEVSGMTGFTQGGGISQKPIIAEPKTPTKKEEFWKNPDKDEMKLFGLDSEEEDEIEVSTRIRVEEDVEVYETEDPTPVDFDEINQRAADECFDQLKEEGTELVRGQDIIDEEISTEAAYQKFIQLEEDTAVKFFKPPTYEESGGSAKTSSELPSEKISRLQLELSSLEDELRELEKEEIPNNLKRDPSSAKAQLQSIDELRQYVLQVVDSASFKDLESKQFLQFGENTKQKDLQGTLAALMQEKVSKLDPQLTKKLTMSEKVDLVMKLEGANWWTSSIAANLKEKRQLEQESANKYIALQQELDQCETVIGQWDPFNKIYNLYHVIDQLQEQIEDLNSQVIPKDDSGSTYNNKFANDATRKVRARNANSVSVRAKKLNQELEVLMNQFNNMKDVQYEKNKIDYVYRITERSLEQQGHLEILKERLRVLRNIHEESPNIEASIKKITEKLINELPMAMKKEAEQIDSVKGIITEGLKELQSLS